MPARYLPMLANACQYPDNAIQCHPIPSSALRSLDGSQGSCAKLESAGLPDGDLHGSISSFHGVGLLFLTQGSFRGLVRLAGAQARGLAVHVRQCVGLVDCHRLSAHHQYTHHHAESPANGWILCDVRAFCLLLVRPLELAILEPWPAPDGVNAVVFKSSLRRRRKPCD